MNTHAQNKREAGREKAIHALLYSYYARQNAQRPLSFPQHAPMAVSQCEKVS